MVKIKETDYLLNDGSIDIDKWLVKLSAQYGDNHIKLIRQACFLAQLSGGEKANITEYLSCLQQGIHMAEILVDLHCDQETIAAAILYNTVIYTDLSLTDVNEQIDPKVSDLIAGVEKMALISSTPTSQIADPGQRSIQLGNLRKMLLAMVKDIRVVLIKLAERTCHLRIAKQFDATAAEKLAKEAQDIYGPLANRLGIGQIKWELEDLAFRYIQPNTYKTLAKQIALKRVERDKYVAKITQTITHIIHQAGITKHHISGRAKHIYSIYRKMQRKNIDFEKIYDATAVRILVPTIEDCYTVLSHIHHVWTHIPEEFDDYISQPKANGYRSLHTAVVGPDNRNIEVQIRTTQMHQEAELGVAAHWKYKEGMSKTTDFEGKINWLRQLLAWQSDVSNKEDSALHIDTQKIFGDRVYVFTPNGEIIDLASQSTPLDFAYHIHSDIGHRCRGAKVNNKIVPLTYQLQTGDQVNILTGKNPQPSQDWLNANAGYLKSSRAKAKISHWFKKQNYHDNLTLGNELLNEELKRHHLKTAHLQQIATDYHYQSANDLIAGIGCGDIKALQVVHKIQAYLGQATPQEKNITKRPGVPQQANASLSDISIQGVNDLLTTIALCCKPIPGDPIIGYITLQRGITIHHKNCHNITLCRLPEKLIPVKWNQHIKGGYAVDISVISENRTDLVKDISTVVSHESIKLLSLTTQLNKQQQAVVNLTIEIKDGSNLTHFIKKLRQIPQVIDIKRIAHTGDTSDE